MSQLDSKSKRALVLGGGGAEGNAWLIGIIAGLFDAGVDVTQADLIIGTSAGSTVAAQITGASPTRLFADIVPAGPQHRAGRAGGDGGRAKAGLVSDHMDRTRKILAAAVDAADMRRKMGAAAIELTSASDEYRQTQRRETVAARLPNKKWPPQELLIAAVNAHTGEPVIFDRHSGVELVDAVAASTAGGASFSIGETHYIDGGYRADVNADLAAGYERVLIAAPFGERTRKPLQWGLHLGAQVDELRAAGSRVETIFPDSNSLSAFSADLMDLSRRLPVARAGYDQGRALGPQLSAFWR